MGVGLEGFGTDTLAGEGGQIVRVTTLDYDGPGSLREALKVKGPRVIVFEVAGTIWSGPGIYDWWKVTEPFVTIAGQTAPSPGITLAGSGIQVLTHDVLMQHIRSRSGDRVEGPLPVHRDAIKIKGPPDGPAEGTYNVVVDHCSFSWGTDESASTWYPDTHDITLRHCIISEGLHYPNVAGATDIMSMGLLVGDHTQRLALIGNLFAHNYERNPHLKSNTSTVIVNNVIYNPGRRAIHLGYGDAGPTLSSIVGNVIIPGQDTYYGSRLSRAAEVYIFNSVLPGTQVYLEDNLSPYRIEGDEWSVANIQAGLGFDPRASEPPLWLEPLTVRPSGEVLDWVLANAGARPWDRDAVDERIICDVLNGTGRIIQSQNDVGGWPVGEVGMIGWYIVPYKRRMGAVLPTRYPGIDDYTAQIEAAGGSWAETEILGDRCLVKVRASGGMLEMLNGVYKRLPKERLDDRLSDLSTAAKQRLRDEVLGMGYSVGEIQEAFPGDLGDYCLGDVLHFMASRRLKPRYDAGSDTIVCDGAVQPCRSVGEVDKEVNE